MPNFTKITPVGVDDKIQRLQNKFYEILPVKWGLDTSKYNCYGRIYRNQDDKTDWVAEAFTGKDYEEVYFNDKVSAVSFFGMANEMKIDQGATIAADIHICFFVNLKELKGYPERMDEEVRIDVLSVINSWGNAMGWLIHKQVTGLDKVLIEYPGTRQSEGLLFRDQQPLHCFRFNCSLIYQPTLIKC